jgi:hypothetical protein
VNSTDPLASQLNALYYGYQAEQTKKGLGVTIRWVQVPHVADGKWFYCKQGCEPGGGCDCKVSASLFTNTMMVRKQGNASYLHDSFGTPLGVIFDQEMVEQTLGKCYYTYDAGTDARYNHGCGCGAPANNSNCSDPQSAYQNIDPLTNKTMTATSADVADCHCGTGKRDIGEPKKSTDAQCYYKGPAFFTDSDTPSELASMMKQRVDDQVAAGATARETEYWNEVVMDGLLVNKNLAKAVKAVVWMKKSTDMPDPRAYQAAKDMATWFGSQDMDVPPIVQVDATVDVNKCGPFKVDHPSTESFV